VPEPVYSSQEIRLFYILRLSSGSSGRSQAPAPALRQLWQNVGSGRTWVSTFINSLFSFERWIELAHPDLTYSTLSYVEIFKKTWTCPTVCIKTQCVRELVFLPHSQPI